MVVKRLKNRNFSEIVVHHDCLSIRIHSSPVSKSVIVNIVNLKKSYRILELGL